MYCFRARDLRSETSLQKGITIAKADWQADEKQVRQRPNAHSSTGDSDFAPCQIIDTVPYSRAFIIIRLNRV